MKTSRFNIVIAFAAIAAMCLTTQAQNKVVYTGELGKKVIGYNGPTPLNITIQNGKIAKIEVLENEESPRYLDKATSKIFPQYIGKTIKQALNLKVDAVSGATYTSNALLENIRLGLLEAQKTAVTAGKKTTAKKVAKKTTKRSTRRR